MDDSIRSRLVPGAAVKVTQQIGFRDRAYVAPVTGTIVAFEQRPTGSWFAHAKGDRLWLDRLVIRKADGEITTLNLDQYTRIEVQPPAAS